MRRAYGYLQIVDPLCPRSVEYDTLTCAHCQRVMVLRPGGVAYRAGDHPPRPSIGKWCISCASTICARCTASGGCEPWQRTMERMEAR
jgi:hypothetical protein